MDEVAGMAPLTNSFVWTFVDNKKCVVPPAFNVIVSVTLGIKMYQHYHINDSVWILSNASVDPPEH